MKKYAILATVALLAPLSLLCQRPFAPVGAKWGGVIQCQPGFFGCPPDYPFFHVHEVTQDTVIQGKYCTMIDELDWFTENGYENFIVHQDGYQIYRYERHTEEFKLVLDFSKEVGESWQIEVPHGWAGKDTFTITVMERDGDFRSVSIDGLFQELPLYEGFGGIHHNKRMLLGNIFFIHADPITWDDLTCYIDPVEGLLYGSAWRCELSGTSDPAPEKGTFSLSPNPASTQVELACEQPLAKAGEWRLRDVLGRVVLRQALEPGATSVNISVENLPNGIYYWEVGAASKVVAANMVIVAR